jgi:two-component system sensor histidine kinase RegB
VDPGQRIEIPFLYVSGVWTAILLGTAFTGVYAWRVAEEARQLSQALAATEVVLAREQHLSQLDGLAAAAAHELGTPLATIALVAKELGRELPEGSVAADDLTLLRQEVDRCRAILGKLASLGQEDDRRFFERMTVSHLLEEIVAPHRSFDVAITVDCRGEGPEPACRRNAGLLYGLANIVDNAVDFAASAVAIEARWTAGEVRIAIRDDGPGFAPDVLLRAGEPYVTTRSREGRDVDESGGGGLGLGLFIAKTLIERTGAQLVLSNAAPPGTGAVVRVTWPRAAFERDVAPVSEPRASEPLPKEKAVPI